ncbi:hypothetical protein [Pseudomonas viridiflava]|uniref:hypothetical protein n=1 Tax=Pseudomonas viridiflava TaxID=33069 RepID=UPI000F03F252|nr:hypothetical protein [Pseudomonas viridiflava]
MAAFGYARGAERNELWEMPPRLRRSAVAQQTKDLQENVRIRLPVQRLTRLDSFGVFWKYRRSVGQ